ncbi:MAG: succinyldiaminopimelate transaminase [Gammaproteobacteria bacterium]|nr:succinyldiaminopimelate transaminase [Gammaproteobacteria bacterium]MBI5614856.1 succinyldiaminopimelate transaminase [Gammaproteobacteria bacterium]
MNPGLKHLQPYPFERLGALQAAAARDRTTLQPINLSIGEPQHPTPAIIHEAILASLATTSKYPATKGIEELRVAIADWLVRRFRLATASIDAERHVLPVNGTREALFAIAQCLVDRAPGALVAMPNPFYQIYEGAALLAGAEPFFMACPAASGFLPDFDAVPGAIWDRCQLVYVCSPGNPSGSVMDARQFTRLIELADRHDFTIVSDECYSELYYDETRPPLGLLEVCTALGRNDYRRCLVMHSLSKRSNAPGLRSGFVAGDEAILRDFLRYRTYHGCAMPLYVQHASIAAWRDETHVIANRARYREKFEAVVPVLGEVLDVRMPEGGFYLWPRLPADDVETCRHLLEETNVLTLPGSFLAREGIDGNPGRGRLRIALVAELEPCVEAAHRIRGFFAR